MEEHTVGLINIIIILASHSRNSSRNEMDLALYRSAKDTMFSVGRCFTCPS